MKNNSTYNIDFIWSSQKEYFSLKPIYKESKNLNLNTRLLKVHKSKIRNYLKNLKKKNKMEEEFRLNNKSVLRRRLFLIY